MSSNTLKLPNISVFDCSNTSIKQAIINHEELICDIIERDYLLKTINSNSTLGYVSAIPDKIRHSDKRVNYTVNGLICFTELKNIALYIELVFVSEEYKETVGQLIDLVYAYAKEKGIIELTLHCLPKSVELFLEHGFSIRHSVLSPDYTTAKAHYMTRYVV
jgi:hypothetical protein